MRSLLWLLALAGTSLSAAAQTFTVTGVFEYEDKAWGYSGWTGSDPLLPIRRADVRVLDNATQAVLGTGSTGQDGSFSVVATGTGVIDVVVRVDCDSDLDGSFQRIRVTTEANTEYQSLSPVFVAHDAALPLDIGVVTVNKITSGSDEANPFNMLDMAVHAAEYMTTGPLIGASPSGSTLRVFWPAGSGSFASGAEAHISDDDGYDDAVILHEVGHVIHNLYSDSDNPGGSHVFGDSNQDPLLSFGEGYATFFGSTIMDAQIGRQAIYMDANGASQSGGFQLRLRVETAEPYASDARGACDEVAVACTLFDILDTEASPDQSVGTDDDLFTSATLVGSLTPHRAWWDVFVGPIDLAASLNMNHAWDGWFSEHGSSGLHAGLEALFTKLRLDFKTDVDEPNNSQAAGTPVVPGSAWRADRTLYFSASSPPAPGTGDHDWYAVPLVIGSRIDVETRYPGAAGDADTQCDSLVEVFTPAGVLAASDTDSGTGLNGFLDDLTITQTGTWGVRVRTASTIRRYGRYDLRVQYDFQNQPPVVSAGPTALPATIDDSGSATLSVTASDPNAGHTLSYQWTPTAGGSILGSGSSVTFVPPTVALTTICAISLLVTDNLGATTGPLVVNVTVEPGGDTCASPAEAVSGGVGKPGLAGTPVLAALNLPTVPNADFALQLSSALPGSQAFLIVGFSLLAGPFDLGTMYPSPDVFLPFTTDGAGGLLLPLPSPDDPLLCGLQVWWQFMVPNDPGAAGARMTSQTNFVRTTGGN